MVNDGTLSLLALAAVIAGIFCYRWLELPMQRGWLRHPLAEGNQAARAA